MTFNISVIYPRSEGSHFDAKYYTEKHMPLVASIWGKSGLTGWQYLEYDEVEGFPWRCACIVSFRNREGFEATQGSPEMAEIFGDIVNFTNTKPTVVPGTFAASD